MEQALLIVLTLAACVIVARLVLKKINPIFVFLIAGIVIIVLASFLTGTSALGEEGSGNYVVDAFAYITTSLKTNVAGVGAIIMTVTGYGAYMNHIKASKKLAYLAVKPLRAIKNKYLVLAGMYVIGMLLKLVITSQAGLAVLLLGTTFPIMLALGVHPLIAASTMCLICIDWGPNDGSTIFAAETSGMPVVQFFTDHQFIVVACIIVVLAIMIPFYYKWIAEKEGLDEAELEEQTEVDDVDCPGYYVLFPLIPLALVLVFAIWPIVPMDVITACFISIVIVAVVELIRRPNKLDVTGDIKVVFRSMADAFSNIVSIIISASVFAQGIKMLGGVSIIADMISTMQGASVLTLVLMSLITFAAAMIMGSGAASLYAFGPLVPEMAAKLGIATTSIMVPMEIGTALGRSLSPVAGAVIAVSGYAKVDLMKVIKINMVPLGLARILNLAVSVVTGGLV